MPAKVMLAEREKSNRVANPELPSVALRGGGDDETTSEIRQIVRGEREPRGAA